MLPLLQGYRGSQWRGRLSALQTRQLQEGRAAGGGIHPGRLQGGGEDDQDPADPLHVQQGPGGAHHQDRVPQVKTGVLM